MIRYPLVLLVSPATDEFYIPWHKEALEMGALALALEVGVIWWSAWIHRQQRQQARSHDQVARLAAEGAAMLDNELVGMAKQPRAGYPVRLRTGRTDRRIGDVWCGDSKASVEATREESLYRARNTP